MNIKLDNATVYHGSNLDILPTLPDNSVDSIVTDPPYELGFMGKSWDNSGIAYSVELWTECMRVLKPGGHLLAFGGSRTWHRLAVAIEDAGFEMRDSIAWLYGSGFPKSMDVSKAIDKQAGAERKVIGEKYSPDGISYASRRVNSSGPSVGGNAFGEYGNGGNLETAPATPEALKWQGWGTALKPAFEPVVVARKPLGEKTVAANVLAYGTGGLNIDASRIGTDSITINTFDNGAKPFGNAVGEPYTSKQVSGRWPANIILDPYTAELLDEQQDASRFFYVAKASKKDRNEGLAHLEVKRPDDRSETGMGSFAEKGVQPGRNFHPTVKPTALMEYLIKLVTPESGTVLDPFTGSGSTGKAALLNGYQFIGIELTEEYLPIIEGRLKWANEQAQEEEKKATLF
jgi:site-specific DNA-methyltransferase (adenine-specific)